MKTIHRYTRALVFVVLIASGRPAFAQTEQAKTPSAYDRIWKTVTEWYVDDANPAIQKVLFTGRFQQDFTAIGADQGDYDEWNVRRMRFGHRVTFLRTFLLHGEVEVNPQERDPFYVRLTDFYVQWSRNPRMVLQVGKQSVPFTIDGATSSKELIAIDRSNLTNHLWFPQEYMPGVSVSGKRGTWVYRAGLYSGGEANREFGEFNAGVFTLGVLGYDLSERLGVKEALLTGNYVYQQPEATNTFTRRYEHIGSINFRFEDKKWGIRTDLSAGRGFLGQSSLWGVTAMPFYKFTDKLHGVTRYTFLDSSRANGLSLGTYENRVVRGRGDRYNELYLGANYFLYGHKLKLQTGVQIADMNDRANDGGAFSGVSWTSGLRIGW